MKNLIIILGSLLLFSCNNDSVVLSQEEYNKLKNEPIPEYPKHFELYYGELKYNETGIILGSDDHEYLITNAKSKYESVNHYVDCKFCKPQENKSKKIKYERGNK